MNAETKHTVVTEFKKGPPLVKTTWTEQDPETGGAIIVERMQRGVLAKETRSYSGEAIIKALEGYGLPPRQQMEGLANHLRDQLERQGLPTDRVPSWVKPNGGQWRPSEKGERVGKGMAGCHWTHRLRTLAEPLSKEATAGELLSALTDLLKRDGIEPHLGAIGRLMDLFGEYRIAGRANNLAHQGIAARKSRAQGPLAKRKRAEAVKAIIVAKAMAYWAGHCALRGDASNTAAAIADEVNAELTAEGLLPPGKSGLSDKTIAEHIRNGTRG